MRRNDWTDSLTTGILTFLFLFVAQSPAQSQDKSTEVIRLLRAGNNQQALSIVDQALAASPHDCRLLTLKGMALAGLDRSQLSFDSFRMALARCPSYLPALEGAAQLEYARHGHDAVSYLQRILAIQPESPTANAMLASLYRARGDCADALPYFERSRPLFAARPELLQGYGSCVAQGSNYPEALALYKELLTVQPGNGVRYDVAFLQWKLDDVTSALATLDPLLKTRDYEPALTLGAKLSEQDGNTPQAVELLRAAILLSPDDLNNYLDFASIAFTHKSFQVGIDMLNAGLSHLPNAAPLYVARGVLEVQLSRNPEAIADFEHAHKLDPKLSFAVDAIGIMQSQLHNDNQSLAVFRSAVKQDPDDPLLQYLLAEQLSQVDPTTGDVNLKEAIAAARTSVKLDPTYQPAHDLLAMLYVKTGQPELAIQQAQLALAHDPNDEVALYQEIMARRRSGNTAELHTLTEKLNEARRENARKEQGVQRYQLQDNLNH